MKHFVKKGEEEKEVKVMVHNRLLLMDLMMGDDDKAKAPPQKQKEKVGVSSLSGLKRVSKPQVEAPVQSSRETAKP